MFVGIALLIAMIFLYWKNRVLSIVLFIIQTFSGMSVMPLRYGDLKAIDISLTFLVFVTFCNWISCKGTYFHKDKLSHLLGFLALFLGVASIFSVFYYNIPILKVFTVVRIYLYILAYFLFYILTDKEKRQVLNIFGKITLISCILYMLQIPLGTRLLFDNSDAELIRWEGYMGMIRFTNVPSLLPLYFFLSIFSKIPFGFKKSYKYHKYIYGLTLLLTFQRTTLIVYIIVILLIIALERRRYLKWIVIGSVVFLPLITYVLDSFKKRDTWSDIEMLFNGGYKNYSTGWNDEASTLTYRVAWVYERLEYLSNRPFVESLFGMGYLSDQDKSINDKYKFLVRGYGGEYNIQILYSFDIAWGNFVTRFGIVGTLIMLAIWWHMFRQFWKSRSNGIALVGAVYILSLFGRSIAGTEISETLSMIMFFLLYQMVLHTANRGVTRKRSI